MTTAQIGAIDQIIIENFKTRKNGNQRSKPVIVNKAGNKATGIKLPSGMAHKALHLQKEQMKRQPISRRKKGRKPNSC